MASIKKLIVNIYNWPFLSNEIVEKNQSIIRDLEWNSMVGFIPNDSSFLDVGCGAGYAMRRAKEDRNCIVTGIDPQPGEHGAGRYTAGAMKGLNIVKGFSEELPFSDNSFDIVYSSHVLEHVKDEEKSLKEMYRVLKTNGVLIIGMPTASMAIVNFFTQLLFTTHHRIVNFFFSRKLGTTQTKFINLFIPISHSYPIAQTLWYDIFHYRVSNWKKTVTRVFNVKHVILPGLYPYPEFRQLFTPIKNNTFSSSVFFICSKRVDLKKDNH